MEAKIVHWKEIVGNDFLDKFTKVSKALIFAYEKNISYEAIIKKEKVDDWQKYAEIRSRMRKCGFEDGKWLGWYLPYLKGSEVKFKTTAPPGRIYISMREFIAYKQGLDQGRIEDEYYNVEAMGVEYSGFVHEEEGEGAPSGAPDYD